MRVTHQLRDFITGDVTSVGYGGRHPNKILIKGRVTTRSAASLQEGLRRPIPSAFGNVLRVLPAVVRVVRRILEVGRVEPRVNKLGNSFETLGIQVVGGTTDLTIGWRRLGLSASRDICRTRTIEGLNPKVRVTKGGVAQAMAKLINGGLIALVKVTVVNEDALVEIILGSTIAIVRLGEQGSPVRLPSLAPGERGLGAGVDAAIEHVDQGVATLLTGQAGPDDGSDVGVIIPPVDQDGPNTVNNHNRVVAVADNSVNDGLAVLPQSEIFAVTLVAVDTDETLSRVGVDKHQRHAVRNG